MSQDKKCYFPYGNLIDSEQENVFPCDPTSEEHSACCPADAVCLSNGLCFQQGSWGNRVARSGCTDQMWEDGSCAGICEDGEWDPIQVEREEAGRSQQEQGGGRRSKEEKKEKHIWPPRLLILRLEMVVLLVLFHPFPNSSQPHQSQG